MKVVHPQSLDDVAGHCPGGVTLGGETYRCADGAEFDVSRGQAEGLADRYGVDLSDITVGSDTDSGCKWCDEYDGEHWKQHASSAHPDKWAEHKD